MKALNKIVTVFLFFIFIFLLDRAFFLPARMEGEWQHESGVDMGTLTFDNIQVINNYEINISANQRFGSFYLLGCYFGKLYLLDKDTLDPAEYTRDGD